VAKYRWLRSQSENSTVDSPDSDYALLPEEPRSGNLAHDPFHRAHASELALYLLDLFPPEVAERYGLPLSRIIFETDLGLPDRTFAEPDRNRQAPPVDDQRAARRPVTVLYKMMPKYTEIARINRLRGTVVVGAHVNNDGTISGIRVARGLPDGLTLRAVLAMRMVRFSPATLNGRPIRTKEFTEFNFDLP
jgi:TonB family protein